MPDANVYPHGWDQERVQRIIDYYDKPDENASDENGVAVELDASSMFFTTSSIPVRGVRRDS